MDTPRANWVSKYTKERHSHSISSVQEDVLNISPRLSYYNPTISLERKLHRRNSLNLPKDIMPKRNSTSSVPSTEANTPRSVVDLVTEIATLELEVAHLERHLLTLYRTAFDQYFPSTSSTFSRASSLHTSSYQPQLQTIDGSNQLNEKLAKPFKMDGDDGSAASTPKYTSDLTDHEKPTISNSNSNLQNSISGHRSLAEHFGSSIVDHVTDISPHRLSEEIIRCISAVYCKLSNAATKSEDSEISISSSTPSGSSSSSSYYSPTETGDGSSSPSDFESPKQKNLPYANTIIVPHIRIDAHRFGYASKMLQNFRTLIRRLEKIDPRQMKYEEQLSFWINIHNALVMHAFLAYGLQKNHMKSTHMILKAAYNVGGHSVNACTIQGSILGCEPHRPALWMLALFSSKRRSTTVNQGHVYALDRPEPLAHFAICTGAISDPPVRIYTAKRIYKELEIAKTEFIRANVSVKKQSKILLPRMLYYFGKDSSFELCDILEIICKCLPESHQRKDIERLCLKKKAEKYVEWLPYKSSFRYVVHRSLAQ